MTISKIPIKKTIKDQLKNALPALKEQLGEKKFDKRIKKATKMLVNGINEVPVKKSKNNKKKLATIRKKQ